MPHTVIPVVVAAIFNEHKELLITQRKSDAHLANLWELPGGKIESDESPWQGLCREIDEEVGIKLQSGQRLLHVKHTYPERSVAISLWQIKKYRGNVSGKEGQAIRWVNIHEIDYTMFPEANRSLLTALQLPPIYFITPPDQSAAMYLQLSRNALYAGIRLIQLRADHLDIEAYKNLAEKIYTECLASAAKLIINRPLHEALRLSAHGFHLKSTELMRLKDRPNLKNSCWCSAACHNLAELQHAEKIGMDFVTLSPILATPSHPNTQYLGWQQFQELVSAVNMPVYALGGMQAVDLLTARLRGGFGVAGIRGMLKP